MNKVIEKLMRFLVIVLFLIYGINLLVYICIDRILDAEEVEKLNRVPNKYVYNEIGFEGPTIYLNNITFNVPRSFIEYKIQSSPIFYENRVSGIGLRLNNEKPQGNEYKNYTNDLSIIYYDFKADIEYFHLLNLVGKLYFKNEIANNRLFDIRRDILYSKLSDLSLWNVGDNIFLLYKLYLKHLQELETKISEIADHPEIEGFINFGTEGEILYCQIFNQYHEYFISLDSSKGKDYQSEILQKIISSIKTIKNSGDTYNLLRTEFENNSKNILTDETLLFTMITLNGINKNDIGDLQKLKTVYLNMENNDSKITIRRKTNKVDQLIKTIRNYN